MKIYSITEARKLLGELVNRVKYSKETIALGKHGKADVFLIACHAEQDVPPLTEVNAASDSFRFLEKEPDLYSIDDLHERYV